MDKKFNKEVEKMNVIPVKIPEILPNINIDVQSLKLPLRAKLLNLKVKSNSRLKNERIIMSPTKNKLEEINNDYDLISFSQFTTLD